VSRINSKSKGSAAEREVALKMSAYKLPSGEPVIAERGCQYAGGPDSPDVKHNIPNVHIEVKRIENFSPSIARKSLAQAKRDAGTNLPVVCWRSNRTDWVCMLSLADLLELLGCTVCGPVSEGKEENGK